MQRKLKGSQAGKPYRQRAQAETTISMIKHNLDGYLRARARFGGEMEMLFKVLVHNLTSYPRRPGMTDSVILPICNPPLKLLHSKVEALGL